MVVESQEEPRSSHKTWLGRWADKKMACPLKYLAKGKKSPLARGREKPLKILSQGRKNPAKNEQFRWSMKTTKKVFAAGKGFLRQKVKETPIKTFNQGESFPEK